MTPDTDGERRAHMLIQRLLQLGLAISCGLMLAGVAAKILTGDGTSPAVTVAGIRSQLDPGDRLMALGALALGLTPVARVLALLLLWSWQRDWRFVWVSAVVIVTLTFAALVAGS